MIKNIMKKENIDIVKAEGELIELYANEIPELAWSTGPASYEYYMKRRSLFDAWVQRLWRAPGTIFSSDSATLSIEEGKLLGVAIAFNGGKYRERIRAGGPLWEEMLKADEVTTEEIAGVTERAKLASWLNPVIYSNTFYVHALAVKPEARGKGVGYSMMEYLFDEAKELGYQEFQLDVLSDNPAVGFYRSLGLEVLAETKAPKPAEFGVPIEFRMGKLLN